MDEVKQPPDDSSLDQPATVQLDSLSLEGNQAAPPDDEGSPRRKLPFSKKQLAIIAGSLLLLLLAIFAISTLLVKKEVREAEPTPITINTQSLDNGTLNKLTVEAGAPGTTRQQLTITPDTLFKNSVEIQGSAKLNGDLDVNGDLRVRGTTTLQGAVGINSNLAVRGSLSVGGALTAPSLNIGTLNTTSITTSSSVTFGGHLIPTGVAPAVRPSVAASGGTVTISGNDTAGTITINIGGGATLAGEMAIITFRTRFAATPKVQLTPINSQAAGLNYYATRSAGFFTVDTASTPANGASYVFDYLVTQ